MIEIVRILPNEDDYQELQQLSDFLVNLILSQIPQP